MLFLLDQGVTNFEEVGPGSVLAKLIVQIQEKEVKGVKEVKTGALLPDNPDFAVRRLQPDLRAAAADRAVEPAASTVRSICTVRFSACTMPFTTRPAIVAFVAAGTVTMI